MGLRDINRKKSLLAVVGIFIIIAFPTMFFGSTAKVDTTEVAFRRNWVNGKVDFDQVYETGFYWKGFFYTMVTFDTTVQTIEFTKSDNSQLTSRTMDGLAIDLDISFQYKLKVNEISQLYLDYKGEFEATFERVARDALRDVVSKYTAIEFFNNRSHIGNDMQEEITSALDLVHADTIMMQLRAVDLPDSFEMALERVEVARQDYEVALREQEAALIRAETEILLATSQANVTLIEAQADADAYIIDMMAQAEALNITLSTEADALYALGATLGLNSTELLTYLWIKAISEHESAYLVIGESTPEILLNLAP